MKMARQYILSSKTYVCFHALASWNVIFPHKHKGKTSFWCFLCNSTFFDLMKMAREYILSSFSHFPLVHTNICLFASWNVIFPHMHTVKTLLANHRMSILIESDLSWWQWPSYKPSPSPKWMSSYRPIHLALT